MVSFVVNFNIHPIILDVLKVVIRVIKVQLYIKSFDIKGMLFFFTNEVALLLKCYPMKNIV